MQLEAVGFINSARFKPDHLIIIEQSHQQIVDSLCEEQHQALVIFVLLRLVCCVILIYDDLDEFLQSLVERVVDQLL